MSETIKKLIRFVFYKNQRRKVFREIKIRKQQNKLIKQQYDKTTENLIVFIVDGASWFTGKDTISGGVLSIASIYEESKKLKNIHNSEVIMLTPKDAHLLLKHTKFDNDITVFRFEQLFYYFTNLRKLIFHIPEYLVTKINIQFEKKKEYLSGINDLHINILNQNILIMPSIKEVIKLKRFTLRVTQTTAHENYSTKAVRDKYEIPLHKLSVFGSPEKYKYIPFAEKEDLMIVSPDEAPEKEQILNKIKKEIPDLKIQIIQNLTYKQYLETISRAKFALTFGEGLDFYFIETVFSGGIGFAVYNEVFFTKDFENLPQTYFSYQQMEDQICKDLISFQNTEQFKQTNKLQYQLCKSIYKYDEYVQNITDFYKGNYTIK